MIEEMVNPFERIMRCVRFSVKLPLGAAYSLLFFAKLLYHRLILLLNVCRQKVILTKSH